MTPFGEKLRALRRAKGVTAKRMAADLALSPAYLSALEHGRRGRPTPNLVRQIVDYFELDWDAAEALEAAARLSHPRVTIDTAGLSPAHTELANRLAERINVLTDEEVEDLLARLDAAIQASMR
jgi:transcriptional regulator with XRE-family HTH domain